MVHGKRLEPEPSVSSSQDTVPNDNTSKNPIVLSSSDDEDEATVRNLPIIISSDQEQDLDEEHQATVKNLLIIISSESFSFFSITTISSFSSPLEVLLKCIHSVSHHRLVLFQSST